MKSVQAKFEVEVLIPIDTEEKEERLKKAMDALGGLKLFGDSDERENIANEIARVFGLEEGDKFGIKISNENVEVIESNVPTMEFFEFDIVNFSYYALIGAESEEKAKEHYQKIVCDIFLDDDAVVKKITRDEAKEKFLSFCRTKEELAQSKMEFDTQTKDKGPYLFIVDKNLL